MSKAQPIHQFPKNKNQNIKTHKSTCNRISCRPQCLHRNVAAKTPDGLLWRLEQTLSHAPPGHQGHTTPRSYCHRSRLHPSVCIYVTPLLLLPLMVPAVVEETVKCILTGVHADTDVSSIAANGLNHHICSVCVCSVLAAALTHLACKWSAITLVFE